MQEGGDAANPLNVHKYVTGVSEESQRTCSLKYDGYRYLIWYVIRVNNANDYLATKQIIKISSI
ncbi:hypothetical protein E5AUHO_32230 [Citrobacter freundii]|nr:hypothetical protein E5AUHO_32230 [Citrobacter freundii]